MEERLFWIGLAMGLYAFATRYASKTGRLDSRLVTGLWHGLFCAMAAFSVTLVAVMSMESRARFTSVAVGVLSTRELYPALFTGLGLGAWGFWRAYRKGRSREARQFYHTEDLEWADTVFSAVLLASVMMYFIVQAFKIPSGSMRQTLLEGDHLFVNKFLYGVRIPFTDKRLLRLRSVSRGDIVVFRFPSDDTQEVHCGSIQYGKDFIKRVIALPGDVIKVSKGEVQVNGKKLAPEPYAAYVDPLRLPTSPTRLPPEEYQSLWQSHKLDQLLGDVMRDEFGPVKIPEASYFVMGDNRDRSCDSRFWGPIPEKYLKGKAWIVYWPPSRMGGVR